MGVLSTGHISAGFSYRLYFERTTPPFPTTFSPPPRGLLSSGLLSYYLLNQLYNRSGLEFLFTSQTATQIAPNVQGRARNTKLGRTTPPFLTTFSPPSRGLLSSGLLSYYLLNQLYNRSGLEFLFTSQTATQIAPKVQVRARNTKMGRLRFQPRSLHKTSRINCSK